MSITTTSGVDLFRQRHGLGSVAGLRDHDHAGLREGVAQHAAQQRIVLGDQDPDRVVHVVAQPMRLDRAMCNPELSGELRRTVPRHGISWWRRLSVVASVQPLDGVSAAAAAGGWSRLRSRQYSAANESPAPVGSPNRSAVTRRSRAARPPAQRHAPLGPRDQQLRAPRARPAASASAWFSLSAVTPADALGDRAQPHRPDPAAASESLAVQADRGGRRRPATAIVSAGKSPAVCPPSSTHAHPSSAGSTCSRWPAPA